MNTITSYGNIVVKVLLCNQNTLLMLLRLYNIVLNGSCY